MHFRSRLHFSVLQAPHSSVPQSPAKAAHWVWGAVILLVDAERPGQKTGPLPPDHQSSRLWKNPELETTQQRGCVCGSVSTQASLLEGQMSKC